MWLYICMFIWVDYIIYVFSDLFTSGILDNKHFNKSSKQMKFGVLPFHPLHWQRPRLRLPSLCCLTPTVNSKSSSSSVSTNGYCNKFFQSWCACIFSKWLRQPLFICWNISFSPYDYIDFGIRRRQYSKDRQSGTKALYQKPQPLTLQISTSSTMIRVL